MKMARVLPTEEFLDRLKRLKKKYPRIADDLQPLINELEKGQTSGDRLQGQSGVAYKVRLPNRDAQRGKSGGYRVIYYARTEDIFYLLTIYSKSEMINVSDALIAQLIDKYAKLAPPSDE
jgi:mRNA-degrading endonuclease RelE of RelBE toxin-antitoxin system